jgi:hypothetical protein
LGRVVSGSLVITRRQTAELLEFREPIFKRMPGFVQESIVGCGVLPTWVRRDHGFRAHLGDDLPDRVPVLGSVSKHIHGLPSAKQSRRRFAFMRLTGRQNEVQRIAMGIGDYVNFRRHPAPATSERLLFTPPF